MQFMCALCEWTWDSSFWLGISIHLSQPELACLHDKQSCSAPSKNLASATLSYLLIHSSHSYYNKQHLVGCLSEFCVFILWGQENPFGWYQRWGCCPSLNSVFYALFCRCFHRLAHWLSSALHRAALLNPLRLAWKHTGPFSHIEVVPPSLTVMCVCCLYLWLHIVVFQCNTVNIVNITRQ